MESFRAHVEWLSQHANIIPAERALESHHRPVRPSVALTFDDGYADVFEHALPLLVEHRLPATLLVTVGLLEREPDVLERFVRSGSIASPKDALTWSQLAEVADAGFTIGSHSWSHRNLALLPPPEVEEEARRSREALEDRLQRPVTAWAYPFGRPGRHWRAETKQAVSSAGYRQAFTTLPRRVKVDDDPLALPRFSLGEGDLVGMANRVRGAWDLAGAIEERVPEWAIPLVWPKKSSPETPRR
ncbi:MAG TPA: polysaccharide deacetylase family protein [Actinomycetota bacterium]|nr:polysaccharide deacetylase family protein [Actinomycetota bacterium]